MNGEMSAGFKPNLAMRSTGVVLVALFVACGDPSGFTPVDARAHLDARIPDGIADARAAADGTHLSLPIARVAVTSVRPPFGSPSTDPAGFTVQAEKLGPALLIAVDPTTLTPPPNVGDVIDFTITGMASARGQRRAISVTDYHVFQTGTDITPLAQELSSASDLHSYPFHYDAVLVTVTGTVSSDPRASGGGFKSTGLGIADTYVAVRGPTALISGVDMMSGCHLTVPHATARQFATNGVEGALVTNFDIDLYNASDYVLTDCPGPKLQLAFARSATSVELQFDRHIEASSVTADGSQLTFDNGLTASAATVSGKTITVTTSPQRMTTKYAVTVASSVTDLRGSGVDPSATTIMFAGRVPPAIVRINEVNARLADRCDLIELRVVRGGTMAGAKITQDTGDLDPYYLSLTFTDFIVQTNDFIVVHANRCASQGQVNETVAPNEQPAATFAANFDTAYDWYPVHGSESGSGLSEYSNVITLYDPFGAIMDAVFLRDGASYSPDSLPAADAVGEASQWTPAQVSYDGTAYLGCAVDDLGATGTSAAGTSIQRIDNNDTNAKTDWTTGAGAPSTWGALNPGQTAF